MPTWLSRSIISMAATVSLLSIMQWASCRFYVLPQIWPWYTKTIAAQSQNKLDVGPMGCSDVDARTVAVLMGVMTTLISLSRNAE